MITTSTTYRPGIGDWAVENDKFKESLRMFKDLAELKPHLFTVKDNGSKFIVSMVCGDEITSLEYGVIYDRFMTPEFKSWAV